MRRIFCCLVPVLFAGSAFAADAAPASNAEQKQSAAQPLSMQQGLQMLKESERQKDEIALFARLAAEKNVEGLIETFDPVARKANGDNALREYLASEVLPFFADFKAVDGYEKITSGDLPGGGKGLLHYGYIVTRDDVRKPFVLILTTQEPAPHVFNVGVNQCVKGRHPVTKGRCD